MNDTVFYVLGIVLVVVALAVSFAGLRFERFPPTRGILIGATLAIAVLVGATMTFAWRNAADEQEHREAELAAEVAANEEAGNTAEADEEAGSAAAETETSTTATSTTESSTTTAASTDEGAQLFESQGCSGCHTLAAAGSTGTTGPDLDGALKGESAAFIKTSIVDPNKTVAKGYPPNVMPQTFGDLPPEQIDALVAYLVESTGGSQ
jgi:mono/diheme cytochrome c family protein